MLVCNVMLTEQKGGTQLKQCGAAPGQSTARTRL